MIDTDMNLLQVRADQVLQTLCREPEKWGKIDILLERGTYDGNGKALVLIKSLPLNRQFQGDPLFPLEPTKEETSYCTGCMRLNIQLHINFPAEPAKGIIWNMCIQPLSVSSCNVERETASSLFHAGFLERLYANVESIFLQGCHRFLINNCGSIAHCNIFVLFEELFEVLNGGVLTWIPSLEEPCHISFIGALLLSTLGAEVKLIG